MLRTLNEDRKIAGFTEIQSEEVVASDFSERLRVYKDVVRDALNRMETSEMIDVVSRVVETTTNSGEHQAPVLIDDVMDGYALDARPFLEKEAGNISKLIEACLLYTSMDHPARFHTHLNGMSNPTPLRNDLVEFVE